MKTDAVRAQTTGAGMQGSAISSTQHVLSLFTSGKEALPLHAGEIVNADVLSVGDNNSVVLRMKGVVVEVQTDVPVRKDDSLHLRVEQQENSLYLKLAGHVEEETDGAKGSILTALNSFEGFHSGTEGMVRLIAALNALPETLKKDLPEVDIISRFLLRIESLSGGTLQDVVENGGVFFEAKLRILALGMEAEGMSADIEAGRIIANDLKASLLRLKDTFLAPAMLELLRSRANTDELIGLVNTVLRNIEYFQLQSKISDSLQFFLPLVWQQLRDGEILLREYDHGDPVERSHTCTVNLDLEGAGRVRIHLLSQGGYVHATCATERDDFSRILRSGAEMLKERFEAAGLRLGHLVVRHQPKIPFENVQPEGLSIRG